METPADSTRPVASAAIATIAGAFALGVATVPLAGAFRDAFGGAPDTTVTLAAVLAVALALGVMLDFRSPSGRSPRPGRAAGVRTALLGALAIATWFAAPWLTSVMVWAGGGGEAGPLATTFARAAAGAILLLPAGLLVGSALRATARALPGGRRGRAVLAAAVAAAALGAALPFLADGLVPPAAGVVGAGGVLLGVGVVAALRDRGVHEPTLTAPAEAVPAGAPLAGAGTAFAAAAFGFLASRAFDLVLGSDLPGMLLTERLFAGGLATGAILAAVLTLVPRFPAGGTAAAAALILGAVLALPTMILSLPWLPHAFVQSLEQASSVRQVAKLAAALAWPFVLPVAVCIGAAAAWTAAGTPEDARARPAWAARVALAAAAGGIAGALIARFALRFRGLEGTMVLALVGTAWLGAATLLTTGRRSPLRVIISLAVVVAALAAFRLPEPDRDSLIVDRNLSSAASIIEGVQKHWTVFDRDGAVQTYTLWKRGMARRLMVNGRFATGTVTEIKSHGLLAHLPLTVHPNPRKVCLLGMGNARSAGAALSHPIEELDLFAADPVGLEALPHFGPYVDGILRDPRLHTRAGDPADLLARSSAYDVILNHASAGWTELSAAVSTREFLELVKSRLEEDGLYAQWLPASSLSKEGFLTLLRTFTSAFPQVEVWAAQAGDVILLAKKTASPHDFARVLAVYRTPETLAGLTDSWLADPVTLLSQFLLSDEAVRRISRHSPIHSRADPQLLAIERERCFTSPRVDPVPGLAQIRSDVLAAFLNTPPPGLDGAVARAITARDMERAGLQAEIAAGPTITDMQDAAEIYERALELNPRDGALRRADASLRSQIGIGYSNQMAFTAAYSNMLRAVETDSTYAQGFANLGMLLTDNEDYDFAAVVTQQAIALAPDDDLLYHQLARVWKKRRFFDKAIPYYLKAMETNPRNVEAAMGYSDTRLVMETNPDLPAALEFLQQYLELEPDNEYLLFRIRKIRDVMKRGLRTVEEEEGAPPEEVPMLLREADDDSTGADAHPPGS